MYKNKIKIFMNIHLNIRLSDFLVWDFHSCKRHSAAACVDIVTNMLITSP
jgi:hypothetical protein